jgi:hypothetical protein
LVLRAASPPFYQTPFAHALRLHHGNITMPPKRKFADIEPEPTTAVPPSLPPSVEEAYRRKCVQLKNRTNEVEDANDAARLRLARIKRQVEKLRIERAFLLEQLSRRTSTNVEDSEGSPSPPPTVGLPCADGCETIYAIIYAFQLLHSLTVPLAQRQTAAHQTRPPKICSSRHRLQSHPQQLLQRTCVTFRIPSQARQR